MMDDPKGKAGEAGRANADEARRFYQDQHGGAAPEETPASHYGAQSQGAALGAGQAGAPRIATGQTGGSAPIAGDNDRRQPHSDPQYHAWREAQMQSLDRDYDAFRANHVGDPAQAFGTWQTVRQSQRDAVRSIAEHMEVVGRDGVHVGTVDKLRGDDIVLTRTDAAAGGVHHRIPMAWIHGVGEKVMLDRPGDQVRGEWMDDRRTRGDPGDTRSLALGERADQGSDGPHILDRSFAGTYDD